MEVDLSLTKLDWIDQACDFVKRQLKLELPEGQTLKLIGQPSTFFSGGLSIDPLIRLESRPGKRLLALIKKREISAERAATYEQLFLPSCQLLAQLPLCHSQLALPIATKLYLNGQKEAYLLMGLPPAAGFSWSHYLERVAERQEGSLKRSQALTTAQEASCAIARAVGELHRIDFHWTKEVGSHQLEQERRRLNNFLSLMEQREALMPFRLEDFKEKFSALFHQTLGLPAAVGYCHGDVRPTNLYYEAATGQVTFIDGLTLFYAIEPHSGRGCGDTLSEWWQLSSSLQLFCHCLGLTAAEELSLQQQLFSSYQKQNPLLSQQPAPLVKLSQLYQWMSHAHLLEGLPAESAFPQQSQGLSYCLRQIGELLQLQRH